MLAFVLSRATNLLNILFWLKINSCFWPIWINFTFSKYLLNWQATIRWKNQLNRANYSLPPSPSPSAPSSLSSQSCLRVLIDYFRHSTWDNLLSQHTRTTVGGVLDVDTGPCWIYTRVAHEGTGRGGKTRGPLPRPPKTDLHGSRQWMTPPSFPAIRGCSMCCFIIVWQNSLINNSPESAGKVILVTSWTKPIRYALQCVLWCPSKGARSSLSCWGESAQWEDCR